MSIPLKEPAESKNWYKDRYQQILVQRRIMTMICVLALFITLAAVLAIARLTPQKSVEPFVIQVDQKSGITQTVRPMEMKELTANRAVNDFFIVQYIRSRETYSATDLARNYNIVRVMSESSRVYPEFVVQADPNNPKSNAARLGSSGSRTIEFKSITYLKAAQANQPQLVQARITINEKSANGSVVQLHKIALVQFEYVQLNLTAEERYINPLGFRVTDYRLDEDVAPR